MICQEFDVNRAVGIRIFNELTLGTQILPRGHALSEEDIIFLKLQGIKKIFGAIMEESDISFQTALGIIAAKISGENTAYVINDDGTAQIISRISGVFINSEDRVAKFNRFSSFALINTIEPYAQVAENEVIAVLEITAPVIPQDEVDELCLKLSGNVELVQVAPLARPKAALIYSKFYNNAPETKHFTNVTRRLLKEFSPLNFNFAEEYNALHQADDVADNLERAIKDGNEIVFIIPGQRSSCERDVIPAAINQIVDEVANPRIALIGSSDLIIAEKRGTKIICLPYNYDKAEVSSLNRYIKQAVFADKLNKFEFEHHQNCVLDSPKLLSPAGQGRLIMSGAKGNRPDAAFIGAVILAAGIGSRAGRNKLMIEVDKEPLFMKAVNAALRSEASPIFVITGYHDEEMQAILENVDVNVLYNPAYRSGVKTSIALGLKSMPGFCEGAVIIPADMPNLTSTEINKLITSFHKGEAKQLCLFSHQGVKANPVIWSKALYQVADIVPENAAFRQVFVEHSDYTNVVELKNKNKLLDVTFPSDIETIADK